jgi:predicted MFS family arabinose efflux permease
MAVVIGLALFASGTPSPLYATYSGLWALSPIVLTLVYAVYAFGVLVTLLLAGGLSDSVGRRPVLIVALTALVVTTVLFMLADSVVWLLVARALQGLATGLALSAASAALLDLHPRRDGQMVGLHNGVASAGGMGLGALVSSLIVQVAPAPRVAPYALLLVLFVAALVVTLVMEEPVADRGARRLRPQRPQVPPEVRPAFVLAALGVLSSWSIGGLALALGPQMLAALLHDSAPLVGGIGIFALAGTAALAQLAVRHSAPWAAAAGGSLALALGLLGIVAAAAGGSGAGYLVATVVTGAGFGIAFLGALRALSAVMPPDQRSSIMSAFYIVAYLSLSVPAILAGLLVTSLGLTTAFELFGAVVSAIALVVAVLAWRSRPAPAVDAALETAAADGPRRGQVGPGRLV